MDATGKYTFKGFEGKSEHTIAEGAKAMARDQVQEIVDAKEIQEASMKARMEAKHKKLSLSLKVAANTGKALQFGTIGTLGMVGGAPAVVAAAGIPDNTTETCLTISSIPAKLQVIKTMIGMMASRTTQYHHAFVSKISEA